VKLSRATEIIFVHMEKGTRERARHARQAVVLSNGVSRQTAVSEVLTHTTLAYVCCQGNGFDSLLSNTVLR
jgi:hypothetical protein